MSYILDALKKAERERGITRVPTPMTVHDYRGMQRNRFALVAGVVLLCAVAIWFFLPSLRNAAGPPSSTGAGAVNIPPSPALQAEPPALQSEAKPEVHPAPVVPEAGTTAAPHNNDVGRKPVERGPRAVQSPPAASQRSTPALVSSPAIEKAPPQPVATTVSPATKEVVPATRADEPKQNPLQEAVSKMTVSLLLYAEAEADRSVWINGRKYVKGNYVDGLYLIESITADGVVLTYQGERAILRPPK